MSNIIPFPSRRIQSCTGLRIGDRVRHKTYGWDGILAAFDWHGNAIATHALVEVAFNGQPARMIAVRVEMLQRLYAGEVA